MNQAGGDTVDYRGVEVQLFGVQMDEGDGGIEFFPEATEFRYLDNGQRLEVLVEGKPVASFNGQAVRGVHFIGVTEASRQRVEMRAQMEAQRQTGPTAPRSSQADPAGAAMPAGDEGRDVHATEPELRAQQLTQEGTPPADVGPLGGVPDAVKDAERAEKADAKAAARAKAGADKD
jgi:hypothetical protein